MLTRMRRRTMSAIRQSRIISSPIEPSKRLLIAEDHDKARRALKNLLERKGFSVVEAADGDEAMEALSAGDAPSIAILDLEMPGRSGLDICRTVRSNASGRYTYLILITAREGEDDIAEAMAARADDFIRKPFGVSEVIARVRNGGRTMKLDCSLNARITELEPALEEGRQLKALLPIRAYCKSVRDDSDYWHQSESYIHAHTGSDFSRDV